MPLMPIDGPSKGPEHKVHNCEYKHDKEALEGWEVLFLNQSRCPDCFGKIVVEEVKVQGLYHGIHTCLKCGAGFHDGEFLSMTRYKVGRR